MDSIIKGVLLVAFVIICVILVLLVLVQDQDNSGMGGLLGGGNSAAFGSHSASVLTKTTVVFVLMFFVITFAIAKIIPTKSDSTALDMINAAEAAGVIDKTAEEQKLPQKSDTKWWNNDNKASTEAATTEIAPANDAEASESAQ